MDIDAGNAFVEAIKPLAKATERPGVASGLGGFGALFDLKAAGYSDPVLVAGTDGVGTKVLIAEAVGELSGLGIDLVAMCVNDLAAQGAEPLFFLDYYATGRLDPAEATKLVAGIAEGCREAGCALIGGETAEMPGVYEAGRFDLAGFAVGAVERGHALPDPDKPPGPDDVIFGLASSGLHSNGFSLVRRVVEQAGLDFTSPAPFDKTTPLGLALLQPTRIYARACLAAAKTGHVRGFAHVTGGGLTDNLPRALPGGLGCDLDAATWRLPPVMGWLMTTAKLDTDEMARTFNCGIGMAVIAEAADADAVADALADAGEAPLRIGTVTEGGGVNISGTETWGDSA